MAEFNINYFCAITNIIYLLTLKKNIMRKTLLIISVIAFSVATYAQTVWNFSNAPYGATPTVSFASTFTDSGLTVGTDGSNLFSVDANSKTIDGTAYTHRLKTGGGGMPVAPSKIPVTRYLSVNVSGPSTLKFGMMSSSSSATRTLILVNEGETFLDSIVSISGSAAASYTYEYTGSATKLYFYSRSSGLNYYFVSATNVVLTSENSIFNNKGIIFNGSEILNENNLSIEVYNSVGKLIVKSTSTINTDEFPKGVYLVKSVDSKGILKFIK